MAITGNPKVLTPREAEAAPPSLHEAFERGVQHLQQNRPEKALFAFRRALRLSPGNNKARYNVALALLRLERLEEAMAEIRSLLDAFPSDRRAEALRRAIVEESLWRLVRRGLASWSGGKPKGSDPPIPITPGPPVSDYVIQDRR